MEKINRRPYRWLRLLILAVSVTLLMLNMTYGLGIREEETNEFMHEHVEPTTPPTTPPTNPPTNPPTTPPTTPPERTIDVEVTKLWAPMGAASEHPFSVEVQLYRTRGGNTTKYGNPVTLNGENDWHYEWTGLSESSTWSVEEADVPDGYTMSVTGSAGSGFTITNTKDAPPTTPPPTPPTTPPTSTTPPATTPPPPTPTPPPPATTPMQTPPEPGDDGQHIFDPNIPGGGLDPPGSGNPNHSNIPKTGDETDPRSWLIILAVSAISLKYVLFSRKKYSKKYN